MSMSQAFLDVVLFDLEQMHKAKSADYGSETDPFANIRNSAVAMGMEPWQGALVRINDKVHRLNAAARGSTLANEGIEDSLLDLASYAIIGLVLYRESKR